MQFYVLPSSLPINCNCWEGDQNPGYEGITHEGHKTDQNFARQAKLQICCKKCPGEVEDELMWVLTELKENKSSFSRTIIYCRSLSSCGQYYYIHFSNKNGMVILSVVCTQCIIQSKISAFPGPYSTLKCPLSRSLLLNSTKLCMLLLASRVQDILQPLQIYHSKPFALVLRHTGY